MACSTDSPLKELLNTVPDSDTFLLTDKHLPFLYRLLHSVAADWNTFALCLEVENRDQIKKDSQCVDYALALALQDWLKSGNASWRMLLEAVASPIGGRNAALAKKLALSYQNAFDFHPCEIAKKVKDEKVIESTEESVRNIQALLQNKVAARWYQMGIVMGVPLAELEMIRSDQSVQSILEKETAMIKVWLRQSLLSCTWQVLVDAVEHNSGGQNPLLAREVAAEVSST